MENSHYDKINTINDIADRQRMIQDYQRTGHLDRDKAIEKIRELRATNKTVAEVTATKMLISCIPFDRASDQDLIAELQMQIAVLSQKIIN